MAPPVDPVKDLINKTVQVIANIDQATKQILSESIKKSLENPQSADHDYLTYVNNQINQLVDASTNFTPDQWSYLGDKLLKDLVLVNYYQYKLQQMQNTSQLALNQLTQLYGDLKESYDELVESWPEIPTPEPTPEPSPGPVPLASQPLDFSKRNRN
ncbi:unknown similar to AMEV032 [Mythimna separata entomopoxvirus 'L']|uniref:Uncharacterized protein n=1 Tax=Mythimna separata entomopoxvirus 'L' TaxID=1293572 RepID=A0A916KQ36_9POXV|nr:unknown similar to AMEV032 [Mythimna separata entomopoxvirus 'L']CCU56254.1 unknown similar to AMEV032 [Mythimna separata entomopoxvirus 'L']